MNTACGSPASAWMASSAPAFNEADTGASARDDSIHAHSTHGVSMTKQVLWDALECGSLQTAIDLENRNQLLVRLTTENLQEAILARRERRKPHYKD